MYVPSPFLVKVTGIPSSQKWDSTSADSHDTAVLIRSDAVKSIIDLDKLELNMEGENPEYNERPTVKDSLKTAFTSQKLYESILEFIEKIREELKEFSKGAN